MSGSIAEERIREKVVAEMRVRYGDARIVHELVLDQGGVRIDVAAVGPDYLAVAEIKSERDVLKRLASQVAAARAVAQAIWVVVAPKHLEAIKLRTEPRLKRLIYGPPGLPSKGGWYNPTPTLAFPNPDHLPGLDACRLLVESDDALALIPDTWRRFDGARPPWPRPADMLQMLWAEELRTMLARHRISSSVRTVRSDAMKLAIEHMTGREIRIGVCRALRERSFPRADPPVTS